MSYPIPYGIGGKVKPMNEIHFCNFVIKGDVPPYIIDEIKKIKASLLNFKNKKMKLIDTDLEKYIVVPKNTQIIFKNNRMAKARGKPINHSYIRLRISPSFKYLIYHNPETATPEIIRII